MQFRNELNAFLTTSVLLYNAGYSGGKESDPTYRFIKDHSEAVLIEFNPNIVSYEDLLVEVWDHFDCVVRANPTARVSL